MKEKLADLQTRQDIKDYITRQSHTIHGLKLKRKDHLNGVVPGLQKTRVKARHFHIMYSILRGREFKDLKLF